jgi:UDP-N-acetylglucosamine 1-carboxyvinyltransferase
MDYIAIQGGNRLSGTVHIDGAKNAAVAIIPAAIASGDICLIENLPHIEDVTVLTNAVRSLGVVCEFKDEHTLLIDSRSLNGCTMTYESVKNIRASYYLLGALLGRFKQAEVPLPGGCNFGTRPIDYHLKGFEALGATWSLEHGIVKVSADKLTGANIYLDYPSVGATINIMIAAVYAEGTTIIENAAKEPHVVDTANFLNKLGAKIKGAGTDTIRVTGVKELGGGEYTVIPDPIETGTYMIAAAITGGDITVENIIPKHMDSLMAKLKEMNCYVDEGLDSIRVKVDEPLKSSVVRTSVYPGFPTDLQPQIATLLCTVNGKSMITETIYDNRFKYVDELNRLGANLTLEGRVAHTEGSSELYGAEVSATDLRAGAALVLAGLAAKGETVISNIGHLDRGYERFEEKFRSLGADIKRVGPED